MELVEVQILSETLKLWALMSFHLTAKVKVFLDSHNNKFSIPGHTKQTILLAFENSHHTCGPPYHDS